MSVPDHDVLTIKQLSEYLMVSEKTIYRMLEKKRLPAIRIGAQWRFRKRDIDAWLDDQVRKVDLEGNRAVLDDLEHSEIDIHALLEPANIWLDVPVTSRDEALLWMVSHAMLDEAVDRQALYESIRAREVLCSTALFDDAAFPHPNETATFRFSHKRVLVAIASKPIDFADPHGHRPRVLAMILARTAQGYLLTISRAIKLFSDHHLIEQLTTATNTDAVVDLIRSAEARLTVPTT
ncbi:MAG: helix-turn-helix domain-containing protein [Thermoanaerobaculia bacterium]